MKSLSFKVSMTLEADYLLGNEEMCSNYLGGYSAAKMHSRGPVFCPVIQGLGDEVGRVVECMWLRQRDLNDDGAFKQAITAVNQGSGADSPVGLHISET